jgi:hypothetical protein
MNREGSDEASSSRRGRCRHWQRGATFSWAGRGSCDRGRPTRNAAPPSPATTSSPNPDLVATRAITVHAAADQVWPWIAQLGQGRGGFYSYDALENLVGCDIHSADRVVPKWQDLKVGDQVKLAPEVGVGVTVVQQGRALVLRGGVPMGAVPPPYDFT